MAVLDLSHAVPLPARYLSWIEDRQLRWQECYHSVLKKCFAYFAKIPQYNSDIRLAEVCIKMVSETTVFGHPIFIESRIQKLHKCLIQAIGISLSQAGSLVAMSPGFT